MQTSATSASRCSICDGQALTPSSQAAGSQSVQGALLAGTQATQTAAAPISSPVIPRASQGGARHLPRCGPKRSQRRSANNNTAPPATPAVSSRMPLSPSRPGVQNSIVVPSANASTARCITANVAVASQGARPTPPGGGSGVPCSQARMARSAGTVGQTSSAPASSSRAQCWSSTRAP